MALMRDDLWEIVSGTEAGPAEGDAEQKKFKTRRNKALSMIVLSIKPELHYLIGREPEDPVAVWKLLKDHFERKTWGNQYELWKQLFSIPRMRELKDGGSVNKHQNILQEIFDSLAVLEDPVTEIKQVMFILASLPELFQTMVTALTASTEDVPPLADVKEKVRSEEMRQKQLLATDRDERKALATGNMPSNTRGSPNKRFTCHFCHKPGHFKRDCRKWARFQKKNEMASKSKLSASAADAKGTSDSDSDTMLVATHALSSVSRGKWMVDSGATCHMCNDRKQSDN